MRVLDVCTDLGTPVQANHAEARPLGKLTLRGEKLLMRVNHNFLWAQFRVWCAGERKHREGTLILERNLGEIKSRSGHEDQVQKCSTHMQRQDQISQGTW